MPIFALLWRRTHPLTVVAVVVVAQTIADVSLLFGAGASSVLFTTAYVLILPYTLVRWASGRDVLIGFGFIVANWIFGDLVNATAISEIFTSLVFLLFPASVGAAVRYRTSSRMRALDQVRLREREQLARELHDTVAHHVSAIAIRAQAGRVVGAADPAAAMDALIVIEAEASRALTEMRMMVGTLREGDEPALAPQQGIQDIAGWRGQPGPRCGWTSTCPESWTTSALGRRRDLSTGAGVDHQCRASCASRDQGRRLCHGRRRIGAPHRLRRRRGQCWRARSDGYGLVGMAERAALLGGTFEAGPVNGPRMDGQRCAAQGGDGPMTIRVLVADDQELIRTGLTMIVDAQPDMTWSAQPPTVARRWRSPSSCGRTSACSTFGCRTWTASRQPDCSLDPTSPTRLAVVVITTFDLDEYVHGALKAGARGFLFKDAGPELLIQAIHAAANGDALIAPNVTVRLLAAFSDRGVSTPPAQPVAPLTAREEEVLVTLARGRTNTEIADELHISLSTVKTHLTSLMGKLGARNRVEMATWAYETGRIKA